LSVEVVGEIGFVKAYDPEFAEAWRILKEVDNNIISDFQFQLIGNDFAEKHFVSIPGIGEMKKPPLHQIFLKPLLIKTFPNPFQNHAENFIIGFDKQKPADMAYQMEGITILMDKKHTMYLMGKAVDFYEGADARGFMFVEQEAIARGGHSVN